MIDADALRSAIRRPLRVPYNPIYRFYEGGSTSTMVVSMSASS